jgi:hypothetical protein
MTSSKGEGMKTGDIVLFFAAPGELVEGVITRVWDKPVYNPYVTIRTTGDEGRTFTRSSSVVGRP